MVTKKILGVVCDIIEQGLFDDEKVVQIGNRAYNVWDYNLGKTEQGQDYVKAVTTNREADDFLVAINADDGVLRVRVGLDDLVFDN